MNLLPDAPSQSSSEEPLYNIGVVTRMTGISMATLRAWERRYDFPEARRTAGGHRLYSEKDIMRLRWVKARIDDGLQTAQAINALKHQEISGQISAEPITFPHREDTSHIEHSSALDMYQEELYKSLVRRDLNNADHILAEALAISNPEDLILHLIGPTLASIGDAWEKKQVSVATEHLATNYLRQRLLMWMVSGPPPLPFAPIVLACAPEEWHEGSLLMLGALLRRRRFPIAYLGQAVPLADLASFVREIKPSAVILVAMTEQSAAAISDWPQFLPEAAQTGRPLICYGGRIFSHFPEWQIRVPGTYLGGTLQHGLAKIENLLGST